MLKTKQDLMQWFNNLAQNNIKNKLLTEMVNGTMIKNIDIENDKRKTLLVLDIIQKYDKELTEVPSRNQLEIFKEIAEQCQSGKFKSINVATQKHREAITAIWNYLKENF